MTATSHRGPSLADKVYVEMRNALLAGEYSPVDRLGEDRLAQIYRVSRTPVREAITRLLSDGLLERRKSGIHPAAPDLDNIDGYYELRVTLELQGLHRVLAIPGAMHDRALLTEERSRWVDIADHPPAPDAGFVESDEQFHYTLIVAAGNPALAEALSSVNARIRPVRMHDYLTADRIQATVAEHLQILDSVLDDELTTAQDLLLDHIDKSRTVVVARAADALRLTRMIPALHR